MLFLLASLSFAGDDVHAVEAEETVEVTGPAVWMTEGKFRQYVKDSRNLESCLEKFDLAVDEANAANDRALHAAETARAQFDSDEELIDEQVQIIADLGAKLDTSEDRLLRVRQQRNVAWGIAGGFLAASTAAVVLTLSN
jgi:hypothetical protein